MNMWLSGVMGAVVGDALGVPVEFKSREYLKAHPVTDMIGYGTYNQPAGTWSDDSSMMLATLRSLQNGFDLNDMMERFCQWMVHGRYTPYGEAFDIGRGTRMSIIRYLRDKDISTCGGTTGWDNGNGSLMRILPVALYSVERSHEYYITIEDAIKMVHSTSGLTHAHVRSQIACSIYMMIINRMVCGIKDLKQIVSEGVYGARMFHENLGIDEKEMAYYWRLEDVEAFAALPEEKIKSSGYVVDSLEAALWCLLNTTSYEECVLKAVNLGEDTDTVASIAGGLAGMYYGYDAIPEKWIAQIPRREWIEGLCEMMEEKWNHLM